MDLDNSKEDLKKINNESENESEYDSDNDSLSDIDSVDEETEEINNDEPLKKKRGRKCKPKDDVLVEKIQKKRGRKPKIKDIDENEKVPKKRGRKPKEKIYSVKELPKTFFEENKNETFILHLPIKATEIDNNPLPSIKDNIDYSIYDENMNNYKINDFNLLPTQLDLLENNNLINNININNLIFDNEKYDEKYDENYEYENYETKPIKEEKEDDENKINRIIKKNLKNIMYEFISANNEKKWPESTDVYCWWCCHPFTWMPCALPEYYKKEKFHVNGCFCTFNCAASYNFSKNDNDKWERYSLLNLMYKKLYNTKFVKISLAPPREILKIFGGYLSIEEFREHTLMNEKVFAVIKPPLISIISKIEENVSSSSKNIKNNYPLTNETILNKTHNNLKLKRSKPVTNPNNTLQSFMDLKII
jgi:hypothetical protein